MSYPLLANLGVGIWEWHLETWDSAGEPIQNLLRVRLIPCCGAICPRMPLLNSCPSATSDAKALPAFFHLFTCDLPWTLKTFHPGHRESRIVYNSSTGTCETARGNAFLSNLSPLQQILFHPILLLPCARGWIHFASLPVLVSLQIKILLQS